MMMEDRFLKRLRKKARKGLRGWPIATIAFYGPNLSQATKVTVGIVPSENAEVEELRDVAGARPAGQCRPRPRKRDIRVKPDKDRRLRTQCPACARRASERRLSEFRRCAMPSARRSMRSASRRTPRHKR